MPGPIEKLDTHKTAWKTDRQILPFGRCVQCTENGMLVSWHHLKPIVRRRFLISNIFEISSLFLKSHIFSASHFDEILDFHIVKKTKVKITLKIILRALNNIYDPSSTNCKNYFGKWKLCHQNLLGLTFFFLQILWLFCTFFEHCVITSTLSFFYFFIFRANCY